MARDSGKKKYWEDDEEEESGDGASSSNSELLKKKLIELLNRVEPLVMSVNNLYNMYAAGVEERPPLERLAHLEQLMNSLMMMPKLTPADRFRYQNAQGLYLTYKTRWAKVCQDLESGKIKRFARPKSKTGLR